MSEHTSIIKVLPMIVVGFVAFTLGGAVVFSIFTTRDFVVRLNQPVFEPVVSQPPSVSPAPLPSACQEATWRQRAITAEQKLTVEQSLRQRLEQDLIEVHNEFAASASKEKKRRLLKEETDAEILAAAKQRLPFPADVDPKYSPVGFQRIVQTVLNECDLGVSLQELDCSEYPCVAWASSGDKPPNNVRLHDCPAWTKEFKDSLSMVVSKPGANGTSENVLVFWAVPPEDHERRVARVRQDDRVQAMYDTYMNHP